MEIDDALQEIDDLINSKVYKNQNFKTYLKRKFSEKGTIYQDEFELIEKTVRLFLKSLNDSEIRKLWGQINSEENIPDLDNYEIEIITAKNELEAELLDLYIEGL